MSLINCPECKKEISDKAISCPNCGYPLSPYRKGDKRPVAPVYPLIAICVAFVLFFIFARVAAGLWAILLIFVCTSLCVFSMIKAYKSVKAKDRRWGCCLAAIISGAVTLLVYLFTTISALIRWIN